MTLLAGKVRPNKPTEIVELEKESLQLIARLLHTCVYENGDDKLQAEATLAQLNYQTSCVSLNGKEYINWGTVVDAQPFLGTDLYLVGDYG